MTAKIPGFSGDVGTLLLTRMGTEHKTFKKRSKQDDVTESCCVRTTVNNCKISQHRNDDAIAHVTKICSL